jgi:hypothetical protein
MRISLSLVFSLCLFTSVQAQSNKPATNTTSKTTRQGETHNKQTLSSLQKRAVYLIDQLSQTAREIDDEQTRIRVRASIADLLWDYDVERSRKLFEDVFDSIYLLLGDLKKTNNAPRLNDNSPEYQLHSSVLRMVSRRDPDLAKKLLQRFLEIDLFREINEHAPFSLQLARNIADINPTRAGQMLETSLKDGVNPIAGMILNEISYNNPDLADKLFLQALTVARFDPDNAASNINALGLYAFPSYGGLELEMTRQMRGAKEPSQIVRFRFLEFAYEMVIKRGNEIKQNGIGYQQNPGQLIFEYQTLQKLLPLFDQYMPDKAAVVRVNLDYIGRDIPRERIEAITNPFGIDRIEGLLEKAKTARSTAERDMLYTQAAAYTNLGGDAEKALFIASEIEDDVRRSMAESVIRYQAALRALSKEDIDAAYQYAKRISFLPQYAIAFSRMVGLLGKAKDKQVAEENKQRAISLINEAEQVLLKAENDPDKAISMLTLAESAIKVDSDRAFYIMQYAIKAINNTDFSPQKSDNVKRVEKVASAINRLNFDQTLTELARQDADRALWLARSLERKELNVTAQLAVCRGMLTRHPEVNTKNTKSTRGSKANKAVSQKDSKDNQATLSERKKPS